MNKPFRTYDELIDILDSRGLIFADKRDVKELLERCNYYRLSGYFREFQESPREGLNNFAVSVRVDELSDLVELDSKLRRLILQALEVIELRTKSAFAHVAGSLYGQQAFYLEPENYLDITPNLDTFLAKMRHDLTRGKHPMVERYRQGDDLGNVPIWVSINLLSFGSFSKMCMYTKDPEVIRRTAADLDIRAQGFSQALHAFSTLRNRCAHYGQLWNRSFDISFKVEPSERKRVQRKFKAPGSFGGLIVIHRWLKRLNELETWFDDVMALLDHDETFAHGIFEPSMR